MSGTEAMPPVNLYTYRAAMAMALWIGLRPLAKPQAVGWIEARNPVEPAVTLGFRAAATQPAANA